MKSQLKKYNTKNKILKKDFIVFFLILASHHNRSSINEIPNRILRIEFLRNRDSKGATIKKLEEKMKNVSHMISDLSKQKMMIQRSIEKISNQKYNNISNKNWGTHKKTKDSLRKNSSNFEIHIK